MGVVGNITIPAEADVRADTTYGPNNTLTGEMSAGAVVLEWSGSVGSMDWATAKAYCENPANQYTRLPTIGELLKGLTDQILEVPATVVGLSDYAYYWSSTEFNTDSAWIGYGDSGDINGSFNNKFASNHVICVR